MREKRSPQDHPRRKPEPERDVTQQGRGDAKEKRAHGRRDRLKRGAARRINEESERKAGGSGAEQTAAQFFRGYRSALGDEFPHGAIQRYGESPIAV